MSKSETFNSDCLEAMREYPDNHFQLCIADPPYGINISRHKEIGYKGFNRFTPKEWDNSIPDQLYFDELFRVAKNQIIFGGNYFSLPPSRGFIIWDKGEGFYNRTYAECEFAWSSFNKNSKIFKRDPLARGDYKGRIHINEKPVALYKWLLKNYAKQGDSILDTHLGSQSSRIAAWDLGFDFTGYELDKEYFDAGNKRFQDHIAQPTLFEAPPAQVVQDNLF